MLHWVHTGTPRYDALSQTALAFLDSDVGECYIEPYFLHGSVTAADIEKQAAKWLKPIKRERRKR
jgi:hypothetical protein